MRLLILGGTGFLGPAIVEAAIARKHTVTLFNRGRTNPQLFPDLERLHGDRAVDDYKALDGNQWDAVIDPSANLPKWVTAAAIKLKDAIKQYVYISSISVYPEFPKPGTDESAPVTELENAEAVQKVTNEQYGGLKAACERAAEAAMPKRTTVIRPGLIVGPMDPTDRFTYWPVRIDQGGEVLAPAPQDAPVQFIDVRDLAAFVLKTIEDGHVGTYNATGPLSPMTFAELLHGIKAVTTAGATFTWVDEKFLLEQQVGPWMELPLWIPQADPQMAHMQRVSVEKAKQHGLTIRPLADTARDTLAWAKAQPATRKKGAGLAAEKEQRVLKAWKEANGAKKD
jgi:2'-hydroxyisoflavone reductase